VCRNGSELFPNAGVLMNSIRHFDSSVNKSPGYEAKLQVVYRTNARPLFIISATLNKQRLRHVRVVCMLLLNGFVVFFFNQAEGNWPCPHVEKVVDPLGCR
jgi:hypothetical protein